mmetsp:Transcript_24860/g.27845  ORF Transcript_24860/g.27845 Transcript_24860/m.27845 type:complete len:232 (-) Transcript_24860:1026-1721(-)
MPAKDFDSDSFLILSLYNSHSSQRRLISISLETGCRAVDCTDFPVVGSLIKDGLILMWQSASRVSDINILEATGIELTTISSTSSSDSSSSLSIFSSFTLRRFFSIKISSSGVTRFPTISASTALRTVSRNCNTEVGVIPSFARIEAMAVITADLTLYSSSSSTSTSSASSRTAALSTPSSKSSRYWYPSSSLVFSEGVEPSTLVTVCDVSTWFFFTATLLNLIGIIDPLL